MTLKHLAEELKRVRDSHRIGSNSPEPEIIKFDVQNGNLSIIIGDETHQEAIFVFPKNKEDYSQVLSFKI